MCGVKRSALEHIVRAAAAATGESDFVVVGSSAVVAQVRKVPVITGRSNAADIYPQHAPDKAWDIELALGSGSRFHETFGYFAVGIAPDTARLPRGWQDRAYVLRTPRTAGAKAICPDIHDLAASSTLAGRAKDREWVVAGVAAGLLDIHLVEDRLAEIDCHSSTRQAALRRLSSWIGRSSRRP